MLPNRFTPLTHLVRAHARRHPEKPAIIDGDRTMTWAALDTRMTRAAAAYARDGLGKGDVVAITAPMSADYLALWLGALHAGLAVAPLPQSLHDDALAAMIADAGAALTFDGPALATLEVWLAHPSTPAPTVEITPTDPFNLIYSSGTTGRPKGIVQPHSQRWAHLQRGLSQGYGPDSVTLVATPLYSNTTLVSLFPTLGLGGTLVLLPKFDASAFLDLAERHRASHMMLVPVQYRRLLDSPDFDHRDLSATRAKFCTSAPFSADLKAETLRRWPGGLTEYYGMTEGGGTCILHCHAHPNRLATVGQPATGSDIRLIDAQGQQLPPGATGEIVGRSPAMMAGYHNLPAETAAAIWHCPSGQRFIRSGDIGRFDEQGFLTLVDRAKDLVISGGFNIYPSDLEAILKRHPAVADAAVVGVVSNRWGETPVGFVVLRREISAENLRQWANHRLGKNQRLSDLVFVADLPRSEIGKVLKRTLRDSYKST
jgi:long-chain acyl-CoA synthetase